MSILIRGVEMPTSCFDCYFQDCGNCVINNHKVVDNCIIADRRDEDCPLVSVTNHHGHLIDALDLMKTVRANEWQNPVVPTALLCIISRMPIIIPADQDTMAEQWGGEPEETQISLFKEAT